VFELFGQRLPAVNGGAHFKFSDAMSLMVNGETQAEIDEYWQQLTADGGREARCGWLQDRFGLRWQAVLGEMMVDPDQRKVRRMT